MCGRVGFFSDTEWVVTATSLVSRFHNRIGALNSSYNTAPSQPLATLLNTGDYTYTRFGLIPHWAKDAAFQPINARAETLGNKPTFKGPFARQRCLVPVNGFYEWHKSVKGKVPFWISPGGEHDFFALAAVYDNWTNPESGETVVGTAIITTRANETMRPIHDRMPVILEPESWRLWLDPDVKEPEALQPLLHPYSGAMRLREVSTYVNTPTHNDPTCIRGYNLLEPE